MIKRFTVGPRRDGGGRGERGGGTTIPFWGRFKTWTRTSTPSLVHKSRPRPPPWRGSRLPRRGAPWCECCTDVSDIRESVLWNILRLNVRTDSDLVYGLLQWQLWMSYFQHDPYGFFALWSWSDAVFTYSDFCPYPNGTNVSSCKRSTKCAAKWARSGHGRSDLI